MGGKNGNSGWDEFNLLVSLAWDMQFHIPQFEVQSERWFFVDRLSNNVKNTKNIYYRSDWTITV